MSLNFNRIIESHQARASQQVTSAAQGIYTNWDHFRFQVLLPLKSFFSLTPEEQHQKELYDIATQVTRAASHYFSRVHEISEQYRRDRLELVQDSQLHSSTVKTAQMTYWSNQTLDQLEKLPDVRGRIKKDPLCKKAQHQMLSAYTAWMTSLDKAVEAEGKKMIEQLTVWAPRTSQALRITEPAFSEQLEQAHPMSPEAKISFTHHALKSLLSKFAQPEEGQKMLETVRKAYADSKVKRLTLTNFVEHLDRLVKDAVALGLGKSDIIRNNLIQAAAHLHGNQLGGYVNSLHTIYDRIGNTTAIQDYFKKEIQALFSKGESMTPARLGRLQYKDPQIPGLQMSLDQLLDGPALNQLAQQLEESRARHQKLQQAYREKCDENFTLKLQIKLHIEPQMQEIKNFLENPEPASASFDVAKTMERARLTLELGTAYQSLQKEFVECTNQLQKKEAEALAQKKELEGFNALDLGQITSEQLISLTGHSVLAYLQEKTQVATDLMIAGGVQTSLDLILQQDRPLPRGHVKLTPDEWVLCSLQHKISTCPSEWLEKTEVIRQQENQGFGASLAESIDQQITARLRESRESLDLESPSQDNRLSEPLLDDEDSLDDMQGDSSAEESCEIGDD